MSILLTNDDGIGSPALPVCKSKLDPIAETIVFVPERNWSASGHPKTLHEMIRVDRVDWGDDSIVYKTSGPPSDCVALALLGILDETPTLVVSGINLGPNLGYDVFYSGTVAAAVEGVIHDLPAIAYSQVFPQDDFSQQAVFAARLAQRVLERGLPADTLLNVNFPSCAWSEVKGAHITRLGRRVYQDELVRRQDPQGRDYFWIGGLPPTGIPDHGTDIWAVENNLVSITPLSLDWTSHRMIEEFKQWQLEALLP